MYLIDSSVWIEYFRPGGSQRIKDRTRGILQREDALCCGIVVVEILRGARNADEFSLLQESLLALPQVVLDEPVIRRASDWGFKLERKGKAVSTTDLLIAAAAHGNGIVLHLDRDFEVIAATCGSEQERLDR